MSLGTKRALDGPPRESCAPPYGRPDKLRAAGDGHSGLAVLLRRSRLELERDEPLVAHDPGIMAGLDDVRRARTDLQLGAVVMFDRHVPRVHNPDVARLATLGSSDGLDAFRPSPPGLEREPRGRRRAKAHHVDLRLVEAVAQRVPSGPVNRISGMGQNFIESRREQGFLLP